MKKKKAKVKKHFTKSDLKLRGWTESAIKKFKLVPDEEKTNPMYSSAPPMKLYLIAKVKRKEKTKGFQEWAQESQKRKESAMKAVSKRRTSTIEKVNETEFFIPKIDKDHLIKLACKSYNRHRRMIELEYGRDYTPATKDSDPEFLNRICVNYLRHNASTYEAKLKSIFGKAGKSEALDIIRTKIYEKIAEFYDYLGAECKRQLSERMMPKVL